MITNRKRIETATKINRTIEMTVYCSNLINSTKIRRKQTTNQKHLNKN